MREEIATLLYTLIGVILFCCIIKGCTDEEMKTVKEVSGYKILELEDGHWYMKSGRSLDHYIECPKCHRTLKP